MDSRRRRARDSSDGAPSTLSKRIKTSFIGVFALSRPSKARPYKTPTLYRLAFPSHEHASTSASSSSRPEQSDTTTATRKRKRTPSDGCHSQSSGDSFNPDALVASKESAAPSEHLRLHESLTSLPCFNQRPETHASPDRHTPRASSSTLPSFKRHTSTPLVVAREAEAELVSPHPHHAPADRKGKARQSSTPCIEVTKRSASSRSQRAHPSLPSSASSNTRKIAVSEGPDHIETRLQRAESAEPSTEGTKLRRKRSTSAQQEEAPPVDLADILFGPADGLNVSNAITKPDSIRPSVSIQDFLVSHTPPTKVSVPSTTTTRIVSPGTSKYFQKTNNATKPGGEKATPETLSECQESVPLSSLSKTSSNTSERSVGDLFTTHEEMICISSSENEQENELLPEVDAIIEPDKQTITSVQRRSIESASQQDPGLGGSNSRKSVKFAIEEPDRDRRKSRKLKRRISSSTTRPRRSAQEYFVGEGEDYLPSDAGELSGESSQATSPRRKDTRTAFGSSPITPLTSSNTRSGVAPVEPELVNVLQILTRSPGSARSNGNTKPTSRALVNRTISDSEDSDDDGEIPLRRLKARSRSPQKDSLRRLRPSTASSAGAARSRKASNKASVAAAPHKHAGDRTLFTRSRAIGESADCRRCHRCETYQPKSKTLRCMACDQAVCTTCLATYYAGHPSYAATLAFMQVDPVTKASRQNVDVSEIDFRCPVCKFLCRCTICLRGPFPKTVAAQASLLTRIGSAESPHQTMQRSESLQSSDADLEPLHWPGLVRGTSTRPNLKVRLRVGRPASYSRLSKSAQNLDSASNAYYNLQDAIAGEAARRAQIDAETDYVPDVSARPPRKNTPSSPDQILASASQTASTDSDDTDIVQVASSRRPRPTLSARVRLATKVGQQLGKSPAYVESRRSPRREGDQLIPYNKNEPVLTLGPEVDMEDSEISDALPAVSSSTQSLLEEVADGVTALGPGAQQPQTDEQANELLDSLLELPDNDVTGEEGVDIPALEDHPSADIDYLSPSDTLTGTSVSSLASPPAVENKTVRFEVSDGIGNINSHYSHQMHAPVFLPGSTEEDMAFPLSSPSSTPTLKSRFLYNPTSPGSAIKGWSSPYLFSTSNHDTMDDFLHGSPSRHTAFDIDLMPDWAFDNLVHA